MGIRTIPSCLAHNDWYSRKNSFQTTQYCGENRLKYFEPVVKKNNTNCFSPKRFRNLFFSPASRSVAQFLLRVAQSRNMPSARVRILYYECFRGECCAGATAQHLKEALVRGDADLPTRRWYQGTRTWYTCYCTSRRNVSTCDDRDPIIGNACAKLLPYSMDTSSLLSGHSLGVPCPIDSPWANLLAYG